MNDRRLIINHRYTQCTTSSVARNINGCAIDHVHSKREDGCAIGWNAGPRHNSSVVIGNSRAPNGSPRVHARSAERRRVGCARYSRWDVVDHLNREVAVSRRQIHVIVRNTCNLRDSKRKRSTGCGIACQIADDTGITGSNLKLHRGRGSQRGRHLHNVGGTADGWRCGVSHVDCEPARRRRVVGVVNGEACDISDGVDVESTTGRSATVHERHDAVVSRWS